MESRLERKENLDGSNLLVRDGRYLTFMLCGDEYGIEVMKIREIIGIMDIIPLPRVPVYVKGGIDLRGELIPVIDLMSKFGFHGIEYTKEACIIVMEVSNVSTGIVADTISGILDVRSEDIEPLPFIGGSANPKIFVGMAKIKGNNQTVLLDVDKVLGPEWVSVAEGFKKGAYKHQSFNNQGYRE